MEKSYKQLVVWQKSYQLTVQFFKIVTKFPAHELYGLTAQMKRSCLSIPSNIAEGYCRNSKKAYLNHISITRGSLAEFETQLLLAKDLNYLSQTEFDQLNNLGIEVSKMLYVLAFRLSSYNPITL